MPNMDMENHALILRCSIFGFVEPFKRTKF